MTEPGYLLTNLLGLMQWHFIFLLLPLHLSLSLASGDPHTYSVEIRWDKPLTFGMLLWSLSVTPPTGLIKNAFSEETNRTPEMGFFFHLNPQRCQIVTNWNQCLHCHPSPPPHPHPPHPSPLPNLLPRYLSLVTLCCPSLWVKLTLSSARSCPRCRAVLHHDSRLRLGPHKAIKTLRCQILSKLVGPSEPGGNYANYARSSLKLSAVT